MDNTNSRTIGDFVDPKTHCRYDLSSTLRLRARSIDRKKLWASKDRSAEFMGDIWALFLNQNQEKRIKTVLHSVCVELIENAVKYGYQDQDYLIIIELCLNNDMLLVYVVNTCSIDAIPELEASARQLLDHRDGISRLFKQRLREAKAAKKMGHNQSRLGFVRIMMQDVTLAWQIEVEKKTAFVTTLAKISLKEGKEAE